MRISIVLLHHNEQKFLVEALDFIVERTDYPYKLIVVDNNSSECDNFWKNLKNKYNLEIIKNNKNNWIYGFNKAIDFSDSKYIALSDADIVVPNRVENICWLTHLVSQMEQHVFIGKIGLALDLDDISSNIDLKQTYLSELKFKTGDMIGSNVIAAVDSTMALYRSNVFITDFKMRIGHMRLLRPYYYCVRTCEDYKARHLGWTIYKKVISQINSSESLLILHKKLNFFGRYGISIQRDLLQQVSLWRRYKYLLQYHLTRFLFSIIVLVLWVKYFISHPMGNMNIIQFKGRE